MPKDSDRDIVSNTLHHALYSHDHRNTSSQQLNQDISHERYDDMTNVNVIPCTYSQTSTAQTLHTPIQVMSRDSRKSQQKKVKKNRQTFAKIAKITAVYIAANLHGFQLKKNIYSR